MNITLCTCQSTQIAVNENPSCKKMNITMITLGSLYSSKEIVDRKARDDKKENAGIEN